MRLRRSSKLEPILLIAVAGLAIAAAGCGVAGLGSVTGLLAGLTLSLFVLFGVACTERVPGNNKGGWSQCCDNGKISSCYCPPNTACNYGWFADCGDGTCSDPGGRCSDGGTVDAGDAGVEAGAWERCCENGTISSCWCPANASCNYGLFTECGNGTCTYGSCTTPDAGLDAKADLPKADLSGTWDPCCNNGKIDTCYCPPGAICNYGQYTDCGGGTCVFGGATCPDGGVPDAAPDVSAPDAGPPDAPPPPDTTADSSNPPDLTSSDAGSWQACCINKTITTCWCPAGVACNYGQYQDCGGGTCAFFGQSC